MREITEESFGIIPLKRSGDGWEVFIILHKHGNHWGFPKGKADHGEDFKESAARELEEETGLKIKKFLQEKPIFEEYTFHRHGSKVHKKVYYFPAIVSGALLLQPEEIRDGKWLTFEEANKQLTFEEARRVCTHARQIAESIEPSQN